MSNSKLDTRIYQLKVTLKGSNPAIWRRILIQEDKTLTDLHYVIQIIMGWTDYHLNQFTIYKKSYTIPNVIGNISGGGSWGKNVKLNELKLKINKKFFYEYDFTAGWEFDIVLESIIPLNQNKKYPTCIAGVGKSPEEECGGIERFNYLKDYWTNQAEEILTNFLIAAASKKNARKLICDILVVEELEKVKYWLEIDKYDRMDVNRYLKLYAKGDERWQEAFDEVICFA